MTKKLTPIRAIRAKCLDCSAGQYIEIKLCPVKECALYPYKMGKRPKKSLDSPMVSEKGTQQKIGDAHE
jgi:hypothetical protein